MTNEKDPPRPPDVWHPSMGPVEKWVKAIEAHSDYWKTRPHEFELCNQCATCELCLTCGLEPEASVHARQTR